MNTLDTDIFVIQAIDNASGSISVTTAAVGYHYGAADSTESDWGVDYRAEVQLLTRNIKIEASDEDDSTLDEPGTKWNCVIRAQDYMDVDTMRQASLKFDYVQVKNCGQPHADYGSDDVSAAVEFLETKLSKASVIGSSSIYSGNSIGILVKDSESIILD